jgi:dUTPase
VQLVDTGFKGPLSSGTFGLIIGRSLNYKKNFEVLPGIIDSDFQGEVKIMIRPLKETIQLHKNQR